MYVARFDRDDGNITKCQKHGVSIAEIEEAFVESPLIAPDIAHSNAEDRFIAIGRNASGRAIFVAFTFRINHGHRFIRPVSARYIHRKERESYGIQSS